MKRYERQALLERIDRAGATVGASIPDRLRLSDDTVALREQVFELQAADAGDADAQATVDELRVELRRVRRAHVERLETADIDRETGKSIVETVLGIDRALGILDDIGVDEDIEERIEARERADQERWVQFLKRALGRSSTRSGGRGGYR